MFEKNQTELRKDICEIGRRVWQRGYVAYNDGNISIRPAGALNATVTVSTWSGEFESATPVTISGSQEGKRFSFTVGTGSARLELEAFDGLIRLEK